MAQASDKQRSRSRFGRAKDYTLKMSDELSKDHIALVSAGLAFYALLAIFPLAIALVSIYGLVSDPHAVQQQLAAVSDVLPQSTQALVERQLSEIVAGSSTSLTLGVIFSILAALWSASAGAMALIKGTNMAWDLEETRGMVKLRGLALLFTLGLIVATVVAVGVVAVLPPVLAGIGLGGTAGTLINVFRWPVLALAVVGGLMLLYRWAPDREPPGGWHRVIGAVVATVLWLAASAGFSIYVSNFASYNETYGTLGAVIVLLMWFYLSGFSILLGAEIDAEIEHRRARRLSGMREPAPAAETATRERPAEG